MAMQMLVGADVDENISPKTIENELWFSTTKRSGEATECC